MMHKLNLPAEPQIVFYPEIAYILRVTLISSWRTSGQQECSLTGLGFKKERKEKKKKPNLFAFLWIKTYLIKYLNLQKH